MSETPPREPAAELDDLERAAAELASGKAGPADLRTLLVKIDRAEMLSREPPALDPDAPRRSRAELRALLDALRAPPTRNEEAPPAWLPRAGYLIEGERGGTAVVRPAFAEALAAGWAGERLRTVFSDLWAVDIAFWQMLVKGQLEPRVLVHAWLASPGRRLVQELEVLRHPTSSKSIGATRFSAESLASAAGPATITDEADDPSWSSWVELHAAVPGRDLWHWKPARQDVVAVLEIVSGRRGDPVFMRGAALAWLLDRAAEEPIYQLDGAQRDLREDLIPALVTGFPHTDNGRRELQSCINLETVALQHAARLIEAAEAKPDVLTPGADDLAARRWAVARWLQGCAYRSPFIGGDEEALAARLRSLLPATEKDSPAHADADPLDPGRFSRDETGLDVADVALVAGALRHYQQRGADQPKLFPTPLPLVQALRRVASRTLNAAELEAESLFLDGRNTLGWPGPHLAPPLAARWLMTNNKIAWLQHVPAEARRESLERFENDPDRHAWVALAVFFEGEQLPEPARAEAAKSWSALKDLPFSALDERANRALMAAGVLDQIEPQATLFAVKLASHAKPEFRPSALEALAAAANRAKLPDVWREAMELLVQRVEARDAELGERQRAALLALRRLSGSAGKERTPLLRRLVTAISAPPFLDHVNLQRELRRLKLIPSPEPRGGHP
jgi:hypothetical protein